VCGKKGGTGARSPDKRRKEKETLSFAWYRRRRAQRPDSWTERRRRLLKEEARGTQKKKELYIDKGKETNLESKVEQEKKIPINVSLPGNRTLAGGKAESLIP